MPTTALLLAAGRATRLLRHRNQHAKACVPVADVTPLQFLLPRLHAAGVRATWINLHYRAQEVRAHAQEAAPEGMVLRFLEEPELFGTGGTLLEVARRDRLPHLLINAKTFTDLDAREVLAAPPGTLVAHGASDLREYGGLLHGPDGALEGLLPAREAEEAHRMDAAVFTGWSRPHPAWVDALDAARERRAKDPLCLIRDGVLPAHRNDPESARVLRHEGFWCEISTPERLAAAERALRQRADLS